MPSGVEAGKAGIAFGANSPEPFAMQEPLGQLHELSRLRGRQI